jgi:hypothetical protein
MFSQYNFQQRQSISLNRALRSYDLTQNDIQDARLPERWYSYSGGVRYPVYNCSDLSKLESRLRQREEGKTQRDADSETSQGTSRRIATAMTDVSAATKDNFVPFDIFIEHTVERPAPRTMVHTMNRTPQDVMSKQMRKLQDLFLSLAACESVDANVRNKFVDTATAKKAWFLNEVDLVGLSGIHDINYTKKYSLQDVIGRSLRKHGRDTLLYMVEARADRPNRAPTGSQMGNQISQIKSFCIKNKLDQYPNEIKAQVYGDAITSLEAKFDENRVALADARTDRDEKHYELHQELLAHAPCPLRMKARLMRYGWSKDKLAKLRKVQEDLKEQIRSLAAIHSDVLTLTHCQNAHARRAPSKHVFGDSTNKLNDPHSLSKVLRKTKSKI